MKAMIVEEKQIGNCKVRYDDDAYRGKTEEEIQQMIDTFSVFMISCMQQKTKTAQAVGKDKQ